MPTFRPRRFSVGFCFIMTYSEKLKDPRWQRRRLEMLEAANWTCDQCGSTDQTLHVHHNFYRTKTDPWNYPDHALRVLCEDCQEMAEIQRRELNEVIECLYDDEHIESSVDSVIGFIKAARMQKGCITDLNHTEFLRNFAQVWGFAKFFEGDARDLIPLLRDGEVSWETTLSLWKPQAERLQRRLEIDKKYEGEEVVYA